MHEAGRVAVLGFPCNQFGNQEPGSNEEILHFAASHYAVNFQMFAKICVNGPETAELYRLLKAEKPGELAWNFTKFLVDGEGRVLERFEPPVTPEAIGAQLPELL